MRRLLLGVLAFIITIVPALDLFNPQKSEATGWLSGYTYRKSLTITGTTAGAQTNYTLPIEARFDNTYFADQAGGYTPMSGLNEPASCYYNGYTYEVYQGVATTGDGNPYIRRYNHATGLWEGPVQVGVNPLIAGDSHGQPIVLIRTDAGKVGRIIVVYGAHAAQQIQWVESTNPEDITSWSSNASIGYAGSFPKLIQYNNGDIYLFFRRYAGVGEARIWAFNKLSSGTDNWGATTDLLDWTDGGALGDEETFGAMSFNGTVASFGMSLYDVTLNREVNQYAFKFNFVDSKVYDAAGTSFNLPVSRATFDSALNKFNIETSVGTESDMLGSVGTDSNGFITDIYAHQDSIGGTYRYRQASWNGTAWAINDITSFASIPAGLNITFLNTGIDLHSSTNIDAYFMVGNGDFELWNYNGSWSKTRIIATESSQPVVSGVAVGVPKMVWNRTSGMTVIFATVDLDNTNYNKRVFGYSLTNGIVPFKQYGYVTLDGKAKSDFSDIRFTANDGSTQLSYYIQSYVGYQFASIWLKNSDVIPASPNTLGIYCYYGNAGASSSSNITNTFLFGDDFELGNFTRWTSAGSKWSANSTIKENGAYSAYGVGGDVSPNNALTKTIALSSIGLYAIHFWHRPTSNLLYEFYLQLTQLVDHFPIAGGPDVVGTKVEYFDGAAWNDFSPSFTTSAGRWDEVILYIDLPNHQYKVSYNGVMSNWVTTVLTTNDITSLLFGAYNVAGRNVYLDDFYIRVWANPEPMWTGVGDAETLPPTVTTIAATNINDISATGSGNLTATNDGNCDIVGIQWGTASGTYTHNVTQLGSFGVGAYSENLTSISAGTVIYFRAEVHSSTGGWGYGNELWFLSLPTAPSAFASVASDSQISLSWSKGAGSSNTTIRGNIGSYPTNISSGTLVYNNTGTTTTHSPLSNGDHWFYRAWSSVTANSTTQYSASYVQTDNTPTSAPISPISPNSPVGNFIVTVIPVVYIVGVMMAMLIINKRNSTMMALVLMAVAIYVGIAFLPGITTFIASIVH